MAMKYETIKKVYEAPVVDYVELEINTIMLDGSIVGGDDDEIFDPDNQNAGGHRGDWENIWGNM